MPRRVGTTDVPSRPVAWGDGALCVDLGPDDAETWERFADVHRGESNPEAVAVAAQEWRLPVTPYRRLPVASTRRGAISASGTPPTASGIDLGAFRRGTGLIRHWQCQRGGPDLDVGRAACALSCWAAAGADVRKVSSAARPDGLAGTAMYDELNAHKTAVELDPRHPAGRRSLDELLATADLLVTSLSSAGARQPGPAALATVCPPSAAAHLGDHCVRTGLAGARLDRLRHRRPRRLGPRFAGRRAADARVFPTPIRLPDCWRQASRWISSRAVAPQHTRVSLAGAVTPLASRVSCSNVAHAPASRAESGGDRHG